MQIDISSRVAVVTGSTRGIGRAIAESLASAGATVAVVGRDLERARASAAEIEGAHGFACDVSDVAQATKLISDVEESLGRVDILVNNAGLTRDNLLIRMKDDDWHAVIDANLRGTFVTTRAAVRGMMKRRWGRVINIASVVGITGNPGQSNYAASKAGLIGFTKSVAKELGSRNVLANVVAPGLIDTDMTSAMPEASRAAMSQQIPLNRIGNPGDVAGAVLFLASDLASYITGQVLVVDGGMVM